MVDFIGTVDDVGELEDGYRGFTLSCIPANGSKFFQKSVFFSEESEQEVFLSELGKGGKFFGTTDADSLGNLRLNTAVFRTADQEDICWKLLTKSNYNYEDICTIEGMNMFIKYVGEKLSSVEKDTLARYATSKYSKEFNDLLTAHYLKDNGWVKELANT